LNRVVERIKAEIGARGVIPFARFMDLALYCPDCGYYEKENDRLGRRGDFYTSVSVGTLFGELLAFQFAEWMSKLDLRRPQLVEAGAHDGKLARDILNWMEKWRPALFEHLEYVIAEPSERRSAWQCEMLGRFEGKIRWVSGDSPAGPGQITGVIFSNELLDALPVHRLGWDASRRKWFEWGVTVEDDRFDWLQMERSEVLDSSSATSQRLAELPADLLDVLPGGFTTEVCPAAETWWRNAATALRCGWLMTLDYGRGHDEFFAAHRRDGTLRAYHRHRVSENLLANVGEQDLTAHVDFDSIQRAGESVGLQTELFTTQAGFFAEVMKRFWLEVENRGGWSRERAREFQTLVHPEHLGRAFRVLVQTRPNWNGTDGQSGISPEQMA
jgi:SAM-dependent MidA family methyltransferase